jgi:hypothetical protein
MVYVVCVLFRWSCSLGPTRHTHMHGKGERKASKRLLFTSCMDDAMVELVDLGSGSAQAKARRESREETTEREEQGDTHGLLISLCDDGRARLVRTAVYGVREASEARAGWRAERAAAEEQPGVPFYRPRCGLCHSLLSVSFRMQQWC